MANTLFTRYAATLRTFSGDCRHPSLLLAQQGPVAVYYAPFDYINPTARVVLVGITPGATQANNALAEARRQLQAGADVETTLRRAKQCGAFSGSMRNNLVALLDHIGLQRWLNLPSCASLFESAGHYFQTASVLPYPVFNAGANYNGTPDPMSNPLLRQQVLDHFVPLVRQLRHAVFIPLGPVPSAVMQRLARDGQVATERILDGMPHPSGANAERINYFLGRKSREQLSAKTDPQKLDGARAQLLARVAAL